MKTDIRNNRETLKNLLDNVAATDAQGNTIPVDHALEEGIALIQERSGLGGKVIFIGNGGSAAIASHMATDFWKNAGVRAVAFNDSVLLTCLGNDLGYERVFEIPMEMFAEANDVLVAISSSGRSENILRGVSAALAKGVAVITLSGFQAANELRRRGKINFYVPSSHYGHVEVVHHSLCHCLVDVIIQNRKTPQEVNTHG